MASLARGTIGHLVSRRTKVLHAAPRTLYTVHIRQRLSRLSFPLHPTPTYEGTNGSDHTRNAPRAKLAISC